MLEVVGQAELLPHPDGPLGGVVLVPLNGIAVVRGEFVVEVVVAFAEGGKGSDHVITGGVAVIKGLLAQPVGKGVDTEGGLLDEEDAQDASVDEATPPVTPSETGNQHGDTQAHGEHDLDVVAVLPDDDRVFVEVGDISAANALGVLLHDHPSQVGVEQTLADGVRVLVGVGITVVGTVVASPPASRTLDGTTANSSEPDTQGETSGIRAVSPKTVVTW